MSGTLTSADRKVIKALMKSEGWSSIMKFVALKLGQWAEQPITGQTAYEELKALHIRSGKAEGVNEVFDQLERQAFED